MTDSQPQTSVEGAIDFATKVLEAKPGEACQVQHSFNYQGSVTSRSAKFDRPEPEQEKIIFTAPGQAMSLELVKISQDSRAGIHPSHNSPGEFSHDIEIIPSFDLNVFAHLHSENTLIDEQYDEENAVMTRKRIHKLLNQFSHISTECFYGFLDSSEEDDKRDYTVWLKRGRPGFYGKIYQTHLDEFPEESVTALINRDKLMHLLQTSVKDFESEIMDVKHLSFEAGIALVINQSTLDNDGRLRNLAHVGVTGSKANAFKNTLERFDDGTVIWTTSDYKTFRNKTGAAAFFPDGRVEIIEGSNKRLGEYSARNLGAEGVDPETQEWTGFYDPDACVAEKDDKYIIRREYKAAVRKHVNKIIDGAAIPGLMPIFDK